MKKRSCNIRDVATLAGVSPGTVSKVLNATPDCRVSREMREKIIRSARRLDYTPNINAKRLFSKRIGVVALVVPLPPPGHSTIFTDLHLCRILAGVEDELFRRGCRLMLIFNRESFGPGREFLELYNSRQIDGLIVWGAESDETYWADAYEEKIPLVFLSSIPDALIDKSGFVSPDFRSSARRITEQVLSAGHRRIAYASSRSANFVRLEIDRGIEEAMTAFGLRREEVFFEMRKRGEPDFAERFARRILSGEIDATAIVTLGCSVARETVEELERNGMHCPRDISAACFDTAFGEKTGNLARCLVDDWQLGVRSVRNLFNTIEFPESLPARELLASEIISGESIGNITAGDNR